MNRTITVKFDSTPNSSGNPVVVDGSVEGIGIIENTLNLSQILCDKALEVGAYNSTKFEVELYDVANTLGNLEGCWMSVYYTGDARAVPDYLFRGKVDSCKIDSYTTRKHIIAYDYLYYVRDIDITDIWNTAVPPLAVIDDITYAGFLDTLCQYMGLRYPNSDMSTLPDIASRIKMRRPLDGGPHLEQVTGRLPNIIIPVPEIKNVTFGNMLRMLCEVLFCTPYIDNVGVLKFLSFQDMVHNINYVTLTSSYARNDAEFENYTTAALEGVLIKDSETKTSYTVSQAETSRNSNLYVIEDNIMLRGISEATVLEAIFDYTNGPCDAFTDFTYTPVSVPLITSNLRLQRGDKCRIDTVDLMGSAQNNNERMAKVNYFYIFAQTFSGPVFIDQLIECKARGKYWQGRDNEYLNGIIPAGDGANAVLMGLEDSGHNLLQDSTGALLQVYS